MERILRVIFILGIIGILIFFYNYNQIKVFRVREVNIDSEKISKSIKITQISDFHSNHLVDLEKLKGEIQKFNPDLIALTGDIIDYSDENLDTTFKLLNSLRELDKPVYFIKGNHETNHRLFSDLENIMNKLEVIILENKAKTVDYNGDKLNIIGLNYMQAGNISKEIDIYKSITADLNMDYYNLLLVHSPNNIGDILRGEEDLILSGHTHGGQVRLPLIGAIVSPGQGLFPKLDKGLFKFNNSLLYIDSGLGNSLAPVRAFNPVQFTNITIDKRN